MKNSRYTVAVAFACVLLVAASCEVGTPPEGSFSTPLHDALKARDYDTATQLLRTGANANAENGAGEVPLVIAADDRSAGAFEIVRELLRFGAHLDAAHSNGETALHHAAQRGNMAVVELLVRHGADVNASWTYEGVVGKRVDTPLSLAYIGGHLQVGEFLESLGARAPENEDIQRYKDLGQIKKRTIALYDQQPPDMDFAEWAPIAEDTALAEVKPELARWFAEAQRLNPEALKKLDAVAEEGPPPGMDPMEWARHQAARIQEMIRSGELTLDMPRRPPPD